VEYLVILGKGGNCCRSDSCRHHREWFFVSLDERIGRIDDEIEGLNKRVGSLEAQITILSFAPALERQSSSSKDRPAVALPNPLQEACAYLFKVHADEMAKGSDTAFTIEQQMAHLNCYHILSKIK
jgi:hypothetical protein